MFCKIKLEGADNSDGGWMYGNALYLELLADGRSVPTGGVSGLTATGGQAYNLQAHKTTSLQD